MKIDIPNEYSSSTHLIYHNMVSTGSNNLISGDDCVITGDHNTITGNRCKITGNHNTIIGADCVIVTGNGNIIKNTSCIGNFYLLLNTSPNKITNKYIYH
jgi:hypothetical protein